MKNYIRLTIALIVFLSGVVLVPAMGLPTQGFNWQRFAGVYNPATLETNHASGATGSFFTIFGTNFSSETMVDVYVNGVLLGNLETTDTGDLLFLIDSAGAGDGYYLIEVKGSKSATTQMIIDTGAPVWPQEDTGPVFNLDTPGVVPFQVLFMPVIIK